MKHINAVIREQQEAFNNKSICKNGAPYANGWNDCKQLALDFLAASIRAACEAMRDECAVEEVPKENYIGGKLDDMLNDYNNSIAKEHRAKVDQFLNEPRA